jgi:hypothetical protein
MLEIAILVSGTEICRLEIKKKNLSCNYSFFLAIYLLKSFQRLEKDCESRLQHYRAEFQN